MEPENLAERALDQLLEVTVLLGADMARDLARRGLNQSRAHALYLLGDEPVTQRTLADAVGLTPRAVTDLVDSLAAAGLVTREVHPTDRRATLVTLSDAGRDVAGELDRGRAELAEQLFADFHAERLRRLVTDLDDTLGELRPLIEEEP